MSEEQDEMAALRAELVHTKHLLESERAVNASPSREERMEARRSIYAEEGACADLTLVPPHTVILQRQSGQRQLPVQNKS